MTSKKTASKPNRPTLPVPTKFQLDIYLKGLQGVLKQTRKTLDSYISFGDDDDWFGQDQVDSLCLDLEDCISSCIYAKRLARAMRALDKDDEEEVCKKPSGRRTPVGTAHKPYYMDDNTSADDSSAEE